MLQNEPDDGTTFWDREAKYTYYDHGPLARVQIGNQEVQGIDYTYTLQGWLKGINSNGLQASNDIGKDGLSSSLNATVAQDVASFSLHYFNGDYSAVNSVNNQFIGTLNPTSNMASATKNLYNGNIGRMITTITDPSTRNILPLGNVYQYDLLQRLRNSESYTGLNLSTNDWGSSQSGGQYKNSFTFDANGNIETQIRYGASPTDLIDNLTYKYHEVNGNKLQNRLYHLNDGSVSTATGELEDMGQFVSGLTVNTANNYVYDAEGRLVKDKSEFIDSIHWRVDGKVKSIIRTPGSQENIVIFHYDAMGNRIAKHIVDQQTGTKKSTYYVLDAQGNTISTYDWIFDGAAQTVTFEQKEKHIYGSSRLGVLNTVVPMLASQNNTYSQSLWTHSIGSRAYEISNHLGNVLSVISDKPIPHNNSGTVDYYFADMRSSQDYSPFGVTLEGREYTLSGAGDYRYGFQGQEMDDEVKGKGNSVNYKYRMHDPRVGRFFAIDPLINKYPWYTPYSFSGNKVINSVEIEGQEEMLVIIQPTPSHPKLMQITIIKLDDDGDLRVTYIHKDASGTVIKTENALKQFKANSAEAIVMNKEYRSTGMTVLQAMQELKVEIKNGKEKYSPKNENTSTPLYAQHLFQMDLAILFKTDRSDISEDGLQKNTYGSAMADIEALNRMISQNVKYTPLNGRTPQDFNLSLYTMSISGETDSRASNYISESGSGNEALGLDRAQELKNAIENCLGGMKCELNVVNHQGAVRDKDRNATVIFTPTQ
jgi:RHS repeat-associated protein